MRITNASMVRSHLYDTQNNLTNMSKINQQISTGKVINTISDDPHKAIKIMNMNNEIKYTEKYNSNIDETVGWMNNTDGALESVGNLLGEIKETILNKNLKIKASIFIVLNKRHGKNKGFSIILLNTLYYFIIIFQVYLHFL